jgi:hypothetical protein
VQLPVPVHELHPLQVPAWEQVRVSTPQADPPLHERLSVCPEVHSTQLLQVHEPLHEREPAPELHDSAVNASHSPWPEQVDHSSQPPSLVHPRVCVPQLPQPWD